MKRKIKFRFLEHKSDVLFRAFGKNLKELTENSAEAMLFTISKTDRIRPDKKIRIHVKSSDVESLFIDTLNLVLAKSDAEEVFFKKISIEKLDAERHELTATCFGASQTPEFGKTAVKAATFHEFELRKGIKMSVRILLDI
ncbi:MAG: archease [Candidatus Marsarchaeota archaeon]|nr:archease [Candidatus Marsarchaeota archaeon]